MNKNTTNEYRYFLELNFVGVNRFKARRYYLLKGIIKYYNVIINGKNFYDHQVDSDIK